MRRIPALLVGGALIVLVVVAAAPDPTALVRRLADRSAARRDEAARELLEMGPAAVEALDVASSSPDPEVRTRARALAALVRGDDGVRVRQVDAAVRDALLAPG